METAVVQKPNATKVATKWALINLFAQIILTYAIQLLNLDPNNPIKYLAFIMMIAFLLMTQKEYRDLLGGYISFGDSFSAGFRYAVFGGLLIGVFLYLYLGILSPEVLTKSMETQRTVMEQKGMSSAEIDKAMNIGIKYGPAMGGFFTAIGYAIMGAIISLIGAAIFKKEKSANDILDELDNNPSSDPTV